MTSIDPWQQFMGLLGWSCINSIILLIESFLHSKNIFICKEDFFVTLFTIKRQHASWFFFSYFLLMQWWGIVLFVIWKPQILFDNAIHGSWCNNHFPSHDFLFSDRISVNSWPNSVKTCSVWSKVGQIFYGHLLLPFQKQHNSMIHKNTCNIWRF